MKKILVTGSAGFIGFHLVNKLIKEGSWDIIGLDNINEYYDVQLKFDRLNETGISGEKIKYNKFIRSDIFANYRFLKLDIKDSDKIMALFETEKFDYVINLAAQAGVRYSIDNPRSYIDSNIYGFLNILEACRHYPVNHLLFASSSSVYGNSSSVPFSVDDKAEKPESLYAATKRSNELMAYSYSQLYKINSTGLRFFTVYGPWGRPDMAYFSFAEKIMNDEPIKVFNNGELARDFTYIDDIVEGIYELLLYYVKNNDVNGSNSLYNIGKGEPVNLLQFIKELETALNKKSIKEFLPMQSGDVNITWADTKELQNITKNIPSTVLSSGINKFVSWFLTYVERKNYHKNLK